MKKQEVIAGIAYLLKKNVVVKADDEEIEVSVEPEMDLSEDSSDEEEKDSPDVEIPMVLEEPLVDPAEIMPPEMMEEDQGMEEAPEESGPEMMDESPLPEVDHSLSDAAAGFLDIAEIPKSGARVERMGSYDVLVLGPAVALNRAQLRYLLQEGLVHMAADNENGGQALVFPAGSRF